VANVVGVVQLSNKRGGGFTADDEARSVHRSLSICTCARTHARTQHDNMNMNAQVRTCARHAHAYCTICACPVGAARGCRVTPRHCRCCRRTVHQGGLKNRMSMQCVMCIDKVSFDGGKKCSGYPRRRTVPV
jgi:hypothetical protein